MWGKHPLISREETLAHCLPIAPSWPGGVTAAPSALLGKNLRQAAVTVVQLSVSYQWRLGNNLQATARLQAAFAFGFLS